MILYLQNFRANLTPKFTDHNNRLFKHTQLGTVTATVDSRTNMASKYRPLNEADTPPDGKRYNVIVYWL